MEAVRSDKVRLAVGKCQGFCGLFTAYQGNNMNGQAEFHGLDTRQPNLRRPRDVNKQLAASLRRVGRPGHREHIVLKEHVIMRRRAILFMSVLILGTLPFWRSRPDVTIKVEQSATRLYFGLAIRTAASARRLTVKFTSGPICFGDMAD